MIPVINKFACEECGSDFLFESICAKPGCTDNHETYYRAQFISGFNPLSQTSSYIVFRSARYRTESGETVWRWLPENEFRKLV